jgi:hypothetical protein
MRANHHAALRGLAQSLGNDHDDGLTLWRRLRRIETTVTAATTAYCNGTLTERGCDAACEYAQKQVTKLFGKLPAGFFVNRDPRGYALKLEEKSVAFDLHRDWGNYQILAPLID